MILWSLAPLAVAGTLVLLAGWLYWEPAVASVRAGLDRWALIALVLQWLETFGLTSLRAVVAPLVVVALAVPVIVLASVLLVAWLMTPALVRVVARRRFQMLKQRGGAAAWWQGLAWSLGCALVAAVALLVSAPLWLVPPLGLVLPALVWGWLAARVYGFGSLVFHASADERRAILHAQRWPLLLMGVTAGLLGLAPALLWAVGALALAFAPLLAVVAVWLQTLVFAFTSLWFAHFTLAQLARLRRAEAPPADAAAPPGPPAESEVVPAWT